MILTLSRKNSAHNALVTLTLIILLLSGVSIAVHTARAVSGSGRITVYAHRIPADYWEPCFAANCTAGTGPGTTMYFELRDSSGNLVQDGYADEHGYTFSGLNASATYFVYPTDCESCHGSLHDVVFQYWGDNSTVRPFAAMLESSLDAWFSCTNSCM